MAERMINDELADRTLAFAERANVDPKRVNKISLELDVLRSQGILVAVTVSGTSMFTKTANFAELGVNKGDKRNKRYAPAAKYLIPKEEIKKIRSVEIRMRQWVLKYSYDITGFRPYRWLPFTAYEAWREKWAELHAEFEEVKAEIIANFDSYVDSLVREFSASAASAWAGILAEGYEAAIYMEKAYTDKDSFIEAVVAEALRELPNKELISQTLQADYRVGMVYGASDFANDELKAAQKRAKAAEVSAKARVTAEAANHEVELMRQERREKELELMDKAAEKRAKIEAMLKVEMEHAREQLSELESPFAEVMKALRVQVAESAASMLDSVKKNGFVRGKIATQGRGLIDFYELLAAHDDTELKELLTKLRDKIGDVGDERDENNSPDRNVSQIADTLGEIIDLAQTETERLTTVSRAAFIEA